MDKNDIVQHAPGFIGAILGALLTKDSLTRKTFLVVGGMAAVYYTGPAIRLIYPSLGDIGVFACGALTMKLLERLLMFVEAISPSDLLSRIYKKVGLEDKSKDEIK